jgi:mono/diheme cytochrome c family protein
MNASRPLHAVALPRSHANGRSGTLANPPAPPHTSVPQRAPQPGEASSGWQIPPNARDEQNPLPVTPALLKKGKGQYESHCKRCHGALGKGDGPEGDPEHTPADLSDASRASRNSDGVMFYKIWNGRTNPNMPAFKSELTKDDVWAIVAYAKTLRSAQ